MDYSAPIYNELAWHNAAERLLGIELTPRCKALRTIAGELGRIQSHLALRRRGRARPGGVYQLLVRLQPAGEHLRHRRGFMSGQRYHTGWTRVGGLNQDLPDERTFVKMVGRFVNDELPKALADVEGLLNRNKIFVERTRGIGTITREEAVAWEHHRADGPGERDQAGPAQRRAGTCASPTTGTARGRRQSSFKVPIMESGDAYARYFLRVEEIKQSAEIIKQLYDKPARRAR